MFVTELDSSKKRAVHDELARLLVQYLKKKFENPQRLTMVLDVCVCVCTCMCVCVCVCPCVLVGCCLATKTLNINNAK